MATRPRGRGPCLVWPILGALVLWLGLAPFADEPGSTPRLARRGGYPGGERCGRRYGFLDCVCATIRALVVVASGHLLVISSLPHDVVRAGAHSIGQVHSPD
jgi:hypothetical protein